MVFFIVASDYMLYNKSVLIFNIKNLTQMFQQVLHKNTLSLIKLSLFGLIVLLSLFGFHKNAKADIFTWDCFSYSIAPDKIYYQPGETITVTASAWNDGCAYDVAWINMVQTVHNVGIDALSSGGNVGTVTFTAPMATGTHYIKANTYRYFEKYVYYDTFAPQVCWPSNWYCAGQSCTGGFFNVCVPDNCGYHSQDCTGGQRVSHSVIGQCCGQGGDTQRSIPFQVVVATATITAASGTSASAPLPHNGTTTITWTSANVSTGEITVNGTDVIVTPHYETVTQSTYHPAVNTCVGPYYIMGIVMGPYCFETQAAYTSTETIQVWYPETSSSTLTSHLIPGKNTITFKGYQTGSTIPLVTKSVDVYMASSTINVNLAVKDPTTGLNVSTTTVGSSVNLVWSSVGASTCILSKNGAQIGSVALSSSTLNGPLTALGPVVYSMACSSMVDSDSKSVTIQVAAVPPPTASIFAVPLGVTNHGSTTISWASTNTNSCSIKKNGSPWQPTLPATNLVGISSGSLTATTTFNLKCTNTSGQEATDTVTVPIITAPPVHITGTCVPTQDSSTNVYVNKPMTWTINLPGYTLSDIASPLTTWTGTDISQTSSGNTLNKIYTTIGSKTISVNLAGSLISNDAVFTATCTASTTVRAGAGTVEEI